MRNIDTNGKLFINKQDVKNKWTLYLEILFHDQKLLHPAKMTTIRIHSAGQKKNRNKKV